MNPRVAAQEEKAVKAVLVWGREEIINPQLAS